MCTEDLNTTRTQVIDDDDDDHDDHDDSDKINDTEGLDPERLKAFNVRHDILFLIKYIFFLFYICAKQKQTKKNMEKHI